MECLLCVTIYGIITIIMVTGRPQCSCFTLERVSFAAPSICALIFAITISLKYLGSNRLFEFSPDV